jgi:hypothetical protein
VVAVGSLLPSVEDWFAARRELRIIRPLLTELDCRHPDIGIGVRPRGPLAFRVAERMSLISDALFLEATAAAASTRHRVDTAGDDIDTTDYASPAVSPQEQARAIADWIYAGRDDESEKGRVAFPGPGWLRQPESYSDREWILEIARQYRELHRSGTVAGP